MNTYLTGLDWAIILFYFAIIAGISWWAVKKKDKTSADDYFLAGRHLGWFVIGASIFASNIGSEHLVGLAGSGATDGVALAHYELHAWCLLVLGWVMGPFFMRSKVFTMPEFLERRFTPKARTVLSIISLIAYILTKIAVGIYAGGIVFRALLPEINFMGMDTFWIGSILLIILTGIYTIIGGLRAVVYTETLQTFVKIIGAIFVTYYGLQALGGWDKLKEICGSEMFNLWKPVVPEGVDATWAPVKEAGRQAWYFNDKYPWPGMLLCAPIIGLWYWCTDQYIVQRILGAPNEKEARRGSIFAAFLKLTPVFLFIIPGMICFALAKSGINPDIQKELFDANGVLIRDRAQAAFPLLVMHVLPIGVRGIVVAGLLAALMSALAGVFNASSSLFTMDFYSRIRPRASQAQLVRVGRVATVVMVIIGILWIPVIQGAKGLYDYLQGIQAYLAPPIFVVFFFGVFMKRLNGPGCLATLLTGFAMGLFRLIVDTPVKLGGAAYAEGSFLWIVNNIFFQYYSLLITIVCIIVFLVVSYATKQPDYTKIAGLTFSTMSEQDRMETRSSWNWKDVGLSVLLVAVIIAIYLYFTG
ncbi:sodium:solute symporter [Terrimonas pollutisoli]|uniref:sodium:solute symporter n=1 Tax=Terrimonas pollutisoli TaxID=3034147 RepID=UPI0023EB80D0|nr:sodium:solute symporter [Terrimonas sp. H1YJ31]